jgi:hypothetical protein
VAGGQTLKTKNGQIAHFIGRWLKVTGRIMCVAAIATGYIGFWIVSGASVAIFGRDATYIAADLPRIDLPGLPRLFESGLDILTRTNVTELRCGYPDPPASKNNTAIRQGGIRACRSDSQTNRPATSQLTTREIYPCV